MKDKRKPYVEDEIDGIVMKDVELGSELELELVLCGNATINEDERKALSLPPKFALYARNKPINCKAEVEKAFTKLRWKRKVERSKKGEGGDNEEFEEHRFYDIAGKNIDLTRLRPTDLPFNKKVYMPPYADEKAEAKIQIAKMQIYAVIDRFKIKVKGNKKIKAVSSGIKSLKNRVKEKEIVCYPTDKSGRLSIDSQQS